MFYLKTGTLALKNIYNYDIKSFWENYFSFLWDFHMFTFLKIIQILEITKRQKSTYSDKV